MYLMYVDESGDTGLVHPRGSSPTRYFCLTGLVVHELRWADTLTSLLQFRHWLKAKYHVYLDDELHASEMFRRPKDMPPSLGRLAKHERLSILRQHANEIGRLANIRLICVCVDKREGKDADSNAVFRRAWYALFQRFENTILYRNFPGPPNDQERGIVFPDATDAKKLRDHLNDMRLRNVLWTKRPGGSKVSADEPIKLLIEDPVCRDSRESYFVQAADTAAFLFKQHLDPSHYMKRHGANAYFRTRLKPVLCTQASYSNPLGIVHL